MKYDIIGDIHGCAKTLTALLEKLGYELKDGIYQHTNNKVIFLGDFIDGSTPFQREVIHIVKNMVKSNNALSVMGNHEFNAIAYATKHPVTGEYLRLHNKDNNEQHKLFLDEFENNIDDYNETITWFKSLPLWLSLDGINIIHACWDPKLIKTVQPQLDETNCLTDEFLINATNKKRDEYQAVETLLKGKEVELPNNHNFHDSYGKKRHHIRIKWWDQNAKSVHTALIESAPQYSHIPDDDIDGDHLIDYGHNQPPVFLGHYWLTGEPAPLAENIACVDYSVSRVGGKLVAYRWTGEQILSNEKFVSVERVEDK